MKRRTRARRGLPWVACCLAACGQSPSPEPVLPGASGTAGAAGGAGTAPVMTGGTAGTGGVAGGSAAGLGGTVAGGGQPAGGGGAAGSMMEAAGTSGGGAGGAAAGADGGGASGVAGNAGTAGEGTSGTAGSPGAGAGGMSGAAGAGGDAATAGSAGSGGGSTRPARVLLYSFSTLDIPSVPAQLAILTSKLESWDYEVDESEDPAVFTSQNLERYAAVGMINTCFWPFGANQPGTSQSEALRDFLQDGGGLFGTHCADVTFQSANPPALYNQLLGGRASSQNFDGTSSCRKLAEHETTSGLPDTFSYTGNLDDTDFIKDDTQILVRCTWGNGRDVAVSWVRNEGPGRVFFSNFAKVDADLTNPVIGDPHLIRGLGWVLGR